MLNVFKSQKVAMDWRNTCWAEG